MTAGAPLTLDGRSHLSPGNSRGRVLVVGDVMTDVIVKPEGPLVRGSDRRAAIRHLPGGSGANQAAWLASFGVPVMLLAKVGLPDRDHLAATLQRRGITPVLAADAVLPTGSLVSIIDPDGQRSFFSDRGANTALLPGDLPAGLLDGVAFLHVSGYALFASPARETVLALMRQTADRGIALTIDPASAGFLQEVGATAFLNSTQGAAFCFANEDEATLLAATADPARQGAILARHYDHAVIKRGARGAEICSRDGMYQATLPAPPVEVVDTTGAGDAFLAAFVAAYLAGAPLDACLAKGITAGSQATTFLGGQPAF
ncbi:MAG TPA: PfkB family carbohydrate kinase [Dongiaceae bacterium]|nr:PfkB family carbohydrate kinase [Dongiaceae bacterium]